MALTRVVSRLRDFRAAFPYALLRATAARQSQKDGRRRDRKLTSAGDSRLGFAMALIRVVSGLRDFRAAFAHSLLRATDARQSRKDGRRRDRKLASARDRR